MKNAYKTTALIAGAMLLVSFLLPVLKTNIALAERVIDSTTLNKTIVKGGDSITATLTVTLSGATPNKWASVEYWISGKSPVCVDTTDYITDGTYTESFSITTPTTEGTYDITFKVFGVNATNCGGTAPTVTTLTNAITVDNTNPTVPVLTWPIDNAAINDNTPLMKWEDSTDNSGINGYEYLIHFNCSDITDIPSSCSNYYSAYLTNSEYQAGTTPDNTYYWQIRAKDDAGNFSDWSNLEEFVIDTQAPNAPVLITPSDNSIIGGIPSLTNTWSAISDAVKYIYESYHDAGATNPRYSDTYTTTSKTAPNVSDTTFWWRVKAVDASDNESAWSDLWKVTIDNTAPVVAITNPPESIISGSVEIRGTVTDANPHHYWWVIQDSLNHTVAGPKTVNYTTSFTNKLLFTWDTTSVSNGTYTVKLEAKDAAGNKDTSSVDWNVVTVNNSTITPTFDPIANPLELTIYKNTPTWFDVTGYDGDGDPLTYTIVDQPTVGNISDTAPHIKYTSGFDITGPDSFTFKVNDGTTDSNIATVSINVVEVPVGSGCGGQCQSGSSGEVLGVSTEATPTPEPTPTPEVTPTPTPEVLGEATCVELITNYLWFGGNNNSEQIKILQQFLNEQMGTQIPITGFYGTQTRDAVKLFQEKYADKILQPWIDKGLLEEKLGTGNVFKTTKWWINMTACPSLNLTQPIIP